MMPRLDMLDALRTWHEALNGGDLDRLDAVLDPLVEVVGPRGSGQGIALMHAWVERAGILLQPQRWFLGDHAAVVEQQARWCDPATGERGPDQIVASTFQFGDGRISRISRHNRLDDALAEAGLTTADEVMPGRQR